MPLPKERDYRTRISVFLLADGRSKYFNFYCIHCGKKVAELSGGEVYQLRDVDDNFNHQKPSLHVRCPGNFCHTWYEYHLH